MSETARAFGQRALPFAVMLGIGCGLGVYLGYRLWYTPPPPERVGLHATLRVEHATDGDTLGVCSADEKTCFRVRLMGIDTPETVHRTKGVQVCGPEAKKETQKLVGKKLKFEFIAPEEPNVKRDKYGRALAYVYTEDGKNFNEELIRQGLAHEYRYREDYAYRPRFVAAQEEAKHYKRGLWSSDQCAPIAKK